MKTRERYKIYLKSDEWKALRRLALDYANDKCQLCNTPNRLNVHHRFYPEVLGSEPVNDLTVLCNRCHIGFHQSFTLKNTNNKAKNKKTNKQKREEKKNPPKREEIKPRVMTGREKQILALKVEQRNDDLNIKKTFKKRKKGMCHS